MQKMIFIVTVFLVSQVVMAAKPEAAPPVKAITVTSVVAEDGVTKLIGKDGKETASIGPCPAKQESDSRCITTKDGFAVFDTKEEADRAAGILAKNPDPTNSGEILLDLKNHIVLRVQSASAK